MIRPAQLSDRDRVCDWARQRALPDEILSGASGLQRAHWLADNYAANWKNLIAYPKVKVWIDEAHQDYLVALHGERDSITGEAQVWLRDFGPSIAPFLGAVKSSSQAFKEAYVIVKVYPGQVHDLESLGFRVEQERILAPLVAQENRSSALQIRRASRQDLLFIANLHCRAPQVYPPAHRQVDADALVHRSMAQYLEMDLSDGSKTRGYIISRDRKPCGYVLYKLGMRGEISCDLVAYIYDLNIKPEGGGHSAARILLRQSATELAQEGYRFMAGDVSGNNRRVILLGGKTCGFQTEWVRWGLDLSSC